jgi:hypothetical protein
VKPSELRQVGVGADDVLLVEAPDGTRFYLRCEYPVDSVKGFPRMCRAPASPVVNAGGHIRGYFCEEHLGDG